MTVAPERTRAVEYGRLNRLDLWEWTKSRNGGTRLSPTSQLRAQILRERARGRRRRSADWIDRVQCDRIHWPILENMYERASFELGAAPPERGSREAKPGDCGGGGCFIGRRPHPTLDANRNAATLLGEFPRPRRARADDHGMVR